MNSLPSHEIFQGPIGNLLLHLPEMLALVMTMFPSIDTRHLRIKVQNPQSLDPPLTFNR